MPSAMQRAASAASPIGTPRGLPNLPVIEHPMSRLGARSDLSIRGSATYGRTGGLQRSQTEVGLKPNGGSDRILNWPPGTAISSHCL